MNNYQQLAECIRSGQADAQQIAAHMADALFAAWYRKRYG